jgi:hypothetical protein
MAADDADRNGWHPQRDSNPIRVRIFGYRSTYLPASLRGSFFRL